MTPEELDEYEAKLRQQSQPGSVRVVVYALTVVVVLAVDSALSWLFWDVLFR